MKSHTNVSMGNSSKQGFLSRATCTAMLENSMPCGASFLKNEPGVMQDVHGYWWCQKHRDRGWLLDWGTKHKYPQIHFTGSNGIHYAIGDDHKDEDLWKVPAMMGHDAMIEAAVAYLKSNERDEVAE